MMVINSYKIYDWWAHRVNELKEKTNIDDLENAVSSASRYYQDQVAAFYNAEDDMRTWSCSRRLRMWFEELEIRSLQRQHQTAKPSRFHFLTKTKIRLEQKRLGSKHIDSIQKMR